MTLFGGNGLPRENHHPKSNNKTLFDLRQQFCCRRLLMQSLSLLDGTIRVIPRVIAGYPKAVANLKKIKPNTKMSRCAIEANRFNL